MYSIYKYPLNLTDEQIVSMPVGSKILSVQVQREQICLWAQVDTSPSGPAELRSIQIIGTGHPVEDFSASHFIGTVQLGRLVFHIFENV